MSKKPHVETPSTTNPAAEPPAAASAAPAPAAGPAAEPAVDYKALYEEANDRWLRGRADFDNYRKRVQREYAEIRFRTTEETVREFLGVHDQLCLALAHAPSAPDAAAIRQGLELIYAEFGRVLEGLGVRRVEAVGKPFDPAFHEAISQAASAEAPAGQVVQEWKAGFVLGDRLLRPATVTVSAGPAAPAAPDNAGAAEPRKA